MNCGEFQRVLPYIIESGGNAEEDEHLQTCPVCSDLVKDLRYIADQAKLLVPMEEPDQRVWGGIQKSLQREGLVKGPLTRSATTWRTGIRLSAVAVVALLALFVVVRRTSDLATSPGPAGKQATQNAASSTASVANPADPDDQRLLAQVSSREPSLRAAYEDNLRDVNAYIAAAKDRVAQHPEDDAAQEHLLQAYDQKAVLCEMAVTQSLQ
jgi:hypothetical protein